MLKKIMATFFIGLLAACAPTTNVPIEPIPDITFKHLKPMSINAASIEFVDRTVQREDVIYVGQRFPTSPRKALQNWVRDRLRADGQGGVTRIIINEASAIEENLERTSGFKGIITDDQSEKYTTTMDIRIEIDPQNGQAVQFVNTRVSHHTTIEESATLQEREWTWFALVEKMMTDFDNRISQSMSANFLAR